MPEIRVLDDATIDKIAAGEVVERPSSVVKELAENAIDACASAVTVEIKEGGTSLIRVTDNGCGIERSQVSTAFLSHSTSKIMTVEDLLAISSLGFRGEALSSIAAVSKVELITRTPGDITGTRYITEGGREISLEEIGAPGGTTFLVRDLFFNVPARKKFLKAPQTEAAYISDMMEHIALSHPEISFKFINNGQIRLHTSGNSRLKDVIYMIYGRDITNSLLEINGEWDGFSVTGYIGKPVLVRGNRGFENYFVNGRYIRSSLMAKAIEDGYHGFVMQHKFPFTVLLISLDGRLVDVNVHPNKMEMRFTDQEGIYKRISGLIHDTLSGKELISDVEVGKESKTSEKPVYDKKKIPEPFESGRRGDAVREPVRYNKGNTADKNINVKPDSVVRSVPKDTDGHGKMPPAKNIDVKDATAKASKKAGKEAFHQAEITDYTGGKTRLLSEEARPRLRIIGQLFETYWLVEFEDRFYMIDQHAAHEKILYEKIMAEYKKKEFASQLISPPIVLSPSMQEEVLLKKYMSYLTTLGFEMEPFGGHDWAVCALPMDFYGLDGKEFLTGLIDEMKQVTDEEAPDLTA
ncbi:MAG: DNA mismatch repair endonuclease MutL, partial [Clostridiales bacterium]|nr:DNA mismatch repair endonuclease MutL [Clostridiales bacterium]